MPYQLERFALGDMLRCSLELRRLAGRATTMEAAARQLCRYLFDELQTEDEQPACVLVRLYKTHSLDALPPSLRAFARRRAEGELSPRTRCLTLLASVGTEPGWNDRRASRAHQVIPLASTTMVERAPMIAQLIRALGLGLEEVVRPTAEVVHDLKGRSYGVFHVPDALDSPYIPAQDDFVRPHGVRSVVGFGGTLPDGELFVVVLFARVTVGESAANRFRHIALDVKGSLMRFEPADVFEHDEKTR